jgi:TATA-box binding protein (TBP) (component of TFIID and TFIIIB)
MAVLYGSHCSYEPEIFPALTYKLPDPKISFNIFGSGNFVMTGNKFYFNYIFLYFFFIIYLQGAKSEQDISKAFNIVYPILCKFNASNNSFMLKSKLKKRKKLNL